MVSAAWLEGFDPSYIFKSKLEFKEWILSHIDLTFLPPYLPDERLENFLNKALEYGFKRVCVPVTSIEKAKEKLTGKNLELITFISSFHGNRETLDDKKQACSTAIKSGVNEIEFSPNLSLAEKEDEFKKESSELISLIKQSGLISKAYLEIDKLPEESVEMAIQSIQKCSPDYISISIMLLEDETYEGENLNTSKEWFSKVDSALGKEKKTGLKVYGRVDSFNTLLPLLFLATNYGWDLNNLRVGTEYGFEIVDGLNVSDL